MGVRSKSQFWESPCFGLLQQINQVLLIPVFFARLGSFFPRNYYSGLSVICTQVYQMVAALTTVAWWFGQFPYIVRWTPHSELGPTCEFRLCHAFTASRRRPTSTWLRRQAIFLLLLTLHKLFIMQRFFLIIIITIISGLHYFLCTGKWSGDFGVTLPVCIDRAMSPLRRVKLSAPPPRDRLEGWNLAPHQGRTTSSIPNTLIS